jgi:hypothetical protein
MFGVTRGFGNTHNLKNLNNIRIHLHEFNCNHEYVQLVGDIPSSPSIHSKVKTFQHLDILQKRKYNSTEAESFNL